MDEHASITMCNIDSHLGKHVRLVCSKAQAIEQGKVSLIQPSQVLMGSDVKCSVPTLVPGHRPPLQLQVGRSGTMKLTARNSSAVGGVFWTNLERP